MESKCDFCRRIFKTRNGLIVHMNKVHSHEQTRLLKQEQFFHLSQKEQFNIVKKLTLKVQILEKELYRLKSRSTLLLLYRMNRV
jgi:uncharacterized C2H2 Zn-finger protein